MIRNMLFFIVAFVVLTGCTRDDLCPADTQTTPSLILTFNDYRNENQRKSVEGISIEIMEPETVEILRNSTIDSIALPLDINSDRTSYRFIRTRIIDTDTIIDTEELHFSYSRNEIYVNRACGFRAEFHDLIVADRNTIGNPWIQEIKIKRDSIVDETKAHIHILH